MDDPRRKVPRTDAVLTDPRLAVGLTRLGHPLVKRTVMQVLDEVRRGELAADTVVDTVVERLPATATGLVAVLNATGVIVHTNLGRAPLSQAAREAVLTSAGYTDVEFDLVTGERAPRGQSTVAALAAAVPDAEAVHVTNNNAAALVLAATALAAGREIIISRGELVEIGDRFRIPDLLESTGARLREVGTTNRTHIDDYEAAINADTAFILSIHPSNFTQSGFVASVPVHQLATLSAPVVHDIGSGLLTPHPRLPDEPDAATSLKAGAALVTASGDKLLGGPQAGLVFGHTEPVNRMRRHPLARALRVDKLTLAALEATLTGPPAPVPAAIEADNTVLAERAQRIATVLRDNGVKAEAVACRSRIGGGGAPEVTLPGTAVAVDAALARPLRTTRTPVIGRVHNGRLLLDVRTVSATDDDALTDAVIAAATATPCA